jgi:hypothetical protein
VVGVSSATSYGSWKQEESVNLEQKSAFVQRCISLSERISPPYNRQQLDSIFMALLLARSAAGVA